MEIPHWLTSVAEFDIDNKKNKYSKSCGESIRKDQWKFSLRGLKGLWSRTKFKIKEKPKSKCSSSWRKITKKLCYKSAKRSALIPLDSKLNHKEGMQPKVHTNLEIRLTVKKMQWLLLQIKYSIKSWPSSFQLRIFSIKIW